MAKAKAESKKENMEESLTLEEGLDQLDDIISKMEDEDISLEDSFSLYKKGVDMIKFCHEKIDMVEKKVKILSEEE